MKNKLQEDIKDGIETARIGIDAVSNIEKSFDPNNPDKTQSIVGAVGYTILFGLSLGSIVKRNLDDSTFKSCVSLSLSSLKGYVDAGTSYYKTTYSTFYDVDEDRHKKIISEYSDKIKRSFPNDVRVTLFASFIIGANREQITGVDFDYGVERIKELDITSIRSNYGSYDANFVNQVIIPNYNKFANDIFKGLKKDLKKIGKIV